MGMESAINYVKMTHNALKTMFAIPYMGNVSLIPYYAILILTALSDSYATQKTHVSLTKSKTVLIVPAPMGTTAITRNASHKISITNLNGHSSY